MIAFVGAPPALAHQELDALILDVTRRIEKTPADPVLYLRRSFYYRKHGDYEKALADLAIAERLLPGSGEVLVQRSHVYLDAGKFAMSLEELNRYLRNHESGQFVQALRARAHRGMKNLEAAARAYALAIKHKPTPDLYKERGDCLVALKQIDDAIANYEDGIKHLNRPVSLVIFLIDTLVAAKRYDDAIGRVNAAMAGQRRKDLWLMRKAEIQEKAGRLKDAAETCRSVIIQMDRMPATVRLRRAARSLRQRALDLLARVESTSDASPSK